jgi:hypothetical protein
MSELSQWLDSCFDRSDDRAPLRAFVLGSLVISVVMVICCVAVDPTDFRMLIALVTGAVFFGGGCSAMFALQPNQFRRIWKLAIHLWPIVLPLNMFIRGDVAQVVCLLFTGILFIAVALTAIKVLFDVVWR